MRSLARVTALLLIAGPACAFELPRFAEIELVGPLAHVVVQPAGGSHTRIEGELASSETRLVVVPLAQPEGSSSAPAITFDTDPDPSRAVGSARFVRWRDGARSVASLGPGLRARARPALAEKDVEISRAAPLVLVAAAVLVLFTRRRTLVVLCVALVSAGVLYPLVSAPVRDLEASVTLVDGDANATSWRRMDGALDELELGALDTDFVLECDPARARVTWFVSLDRARAWRVRAPGARLFVARAITVAEGTLTRATNGYAAFDEIWLREEGEWKRLPKWELGAPLSAPVGDGLPPAWLASGLPQGVSIVIARERATASKSATWVRVSGL